MRHEITRGALDRATAAAGLEAAENDRTGAFPAKALSALGAEGWLARPPLDGAEMRHLLHLLAAVGRGDLSVGRIFEGHVNALFLVERHGSRTQRDLVRAEAEAGRMLGVWNTDAPGNRLALEAGSLRGAKSFATGIDGLGRAIVTVEVEAGRQMLLVPLDGVAVDRSWWTPLGMRASGSHVVDFTGLTIEEEWLLGAPGDYLREPWFSAGACRFAAVQVGGMHAVFDTAAEHLRRAGRSGDPYQAQRVARMGLALQSAYGWLDTAARAWAAASAEPAAPGDGDRAIAAANAARCAVEAHAMQLMEEAERGVGAAGFLAPHPLERRTRDLRTYLRQPNPDGALAAVGRAVADGIWAPGPAGRDPEA